MSNAAIFISWGAPLAGRENKALEVFNQVLEYNTRLKKEGKITDHRTYLSTNGNTSELGGFMVVEGEVAQLRSMIDSTEFQTNYLKAQHLVSNVELVHCVTGTEIGKRVEMVLGVRRELGIT